MQRGIRHRLGVSSHICWVSCCSCQSFWKLHWLSAAKWPEISAQIKDHLLLYCSCKGWTRQRLGVSSHLCCVGCCSCQFFWEYYWPNAAKWLEISIKTKDHQLFCKVVGHVDGTHLGLAVYVWFGSIWWIWMAVKRLHNQVQTCYVTLWSFPEELRHYCIWKDSFSWLHTIHNSHQN